MIESNAGGSKPVVRIYLARNIGSFGQFTEGEDWWRCAGASLLRATAKRSEFVITNPAETDIPVSESRLRYEYCVNEIKGSDVVVVDVMDRRGIGVGAEMMLASNLAIPIVAICPPETYYRKRGAIGTRTFEWIHPFVLSLATKIVDSIEQCGAAVESIVLDKGLE